MKRYVLLLQCLLLSGSYSLSANDPPVFPIYDKRITTELQDQRETSIAISPLSNPADEIQLIGWMDQAPRSGRP